MSGLLKSDFYKLSKMKSFPICLLIVVALTVGSVFIQDYSAQFLGEGIVYNGSNQLLSTFAGDCKIFIAIVVSIFAASEFGFGTIKNTASRGFSRISIYFSKLIVSCFIALMIQLVYSIAYTGTATILWGFGEVSASYWPETLKIVGLEFLLTFAYTAVFVMVAMLIRQSGGAIAINLCITMQFIYLFVSLAQMALHEFFNLEVGEADRANGKRQGVRKTAKDISEQKKQVTTDKIHTADAGDQTAVFFENVVFGYDEHLVLEGVSFEVKKGEQVTLSGRTGAGKSTILKLLLGLYEPQSGSIRIDNVSATEVPEEERRSLFGYVEQSFHMVPGTVREQITLYDRRITEKQVQAAARLTGLEDSIASLENGYDTVCTPEIFSQGQWQLLSIARAAVAEPSILLLDEITANLDVETEKEVLQALRRVSENRTVISISHRTSAEMGRIITV